MKTWSVIVTSEGWCGVKPRRYRPWGSGMFWLLTAHTRDAIRFSPFRGLHRFAITSRHVPYFGPLHVLGGYQGKLDVKKVKLSERSSVRHLAALESHSFRDYLGILEALAVLQYEDGSPRQSGYLGIWTQGSTWFVRVNDKDASAQLTCEGRTIDEALATLNLMLSASDAPWEAAKGHKRR